MSGLNCYRSYFINSMSIVNFMCFVLSGQYEHVMLLELLKMGHPEPDKKIGAGIRSFQVQNHLVWKSKCFFLIRGDDSRDDFSFRKCVDHIIPLPEEMQLKSHANQMLGGGGKGRGGRGGRGGGRGHGKGGKFRH